MPYSIIGCLSRFVKLAISLKISSIDCLLHIYVWTVPPRFGAMRDGATQRSISIDDIGTHSSRKGAVTYASSGSTSGSSSASIHMRAGRSMGVVQDAYIHHEHIIMWAKLSAGFQVILQPLLYSHHSFVMLTLGMPFVPASGIPALLPSHLHR
jgi:hypothetical protein